MAMPKDECAAGIYPLEGDAYEDPHNQFTPLNPQPTGDQQKTVVAKCQFCEQWIAVKVVPPRKGYFIWHKSSIKGNVRASETTASGKPARIRGRRQ